MSTYVNTSGSMQFLVFNKSHKWRQRNFYAHVLTRYVPSIMKDTYKRHSIGIRTFSMEGFEYKNYTSKQVLNNRTNGKLNSNICIQSMRILQLLYHYGYHDPVAEVKRRKNRVTSVLLVTKSKLLKFQLRQLQPQVKQLHM